MTKEKKRKVIQIISPSDYVYTKENDNQLLLIALCNDGSIWKLYENTEDPEKTEWVYINTDRTRIPIG